MTAATLLELAREQKILISTAESCTAGLIAGAITEVAGSSTIFDRGFVTYSNNAKVQMLGIQPETLEAHGAVSEEIAREMAKGALTRSDADLSVAVTGIAGPGGSEFKPEGRVCFGLAATGRQTWAETKDFGAIGRSQVRAATVTHALELLINRLNEAKAASNDVPPPPVADFARILLGGLISSVTKRQGDTIVTLVDGTQLTIYNTCTLSTTENAAYRNERITDVTARPDAFTLRLSGGRDIVVGLSKHDFRGPEAFRLRTGKSTVMVWP